MAIRKMRVVGEDDEILRTKCKEVEQMTPKIKKLIKDMLDTMYEQNGVGLAAPQVGVLKRIVVIDIGEGPYVFINPEILETDGEQTGNEGCLSIPGKFAVVTRPNHVVVRAYNEDMEEFVLEAEELMARAVCHECDHLDGVLYIDKMEGTLHDNDELED